MGQLDDGQRYSAKLQGELDRLADAPISDDDRRTIRETVQHADAVDNLADATLRQIALYLRMAAQRAPTDAPLLEWEVADIDALCFALKHDHGLSAGTVRNHRKVLKRHFRYHGRAELADSFTLGTQTSTAVDTDDILTQGEIDALFDAAPTTREQAIIALLLDMGLRLGALVSLRIGDLTLTDDAGFVDLNTDGNVKDADGTLPLTWSRGYLIRWLHVHPHPEDDDAALICALPSARHQGNSADGTGALTTAHVRRRLYDVAEAAGIGRKRAKPHRFRKTAVSQWVRDGLPEQDIKHRAGWTPDSQQLDTYSHVTDEEFNDRVLDHYGLGSEDGTSASPTLDQCPQCSTSLREGVRFCPTCGLALSPDAADRHSDAVTTVADDMLADDLSDDQRKIARTILGIIQNNPSVTQ